MHERCIGISQVTPRQASLNADGAQQRGLVILRKGFLDPVVDVDKH